ncbi:MULTISPECIES: hypothetical protein [unclassified Marinovum]
MIKTLFCAALLAVLPVVSFASCSGGHQAMSCAQGSVWDQETEACVEQVAS